MKWDGHTHSEFCRHGSGQKTADMVQRALELGFQRYSITEHAPLPHGILPDPETEADFVLMHDEIDDYFSHIDELKRVYSDRITILAGLELDFIPGYEDYYIDFIKTCRHRLDDLIVSLHFIPGADGPCPVDYSTDWFERKLINYYGSVQKVHDVYWEGIKKLVETDISPVDRKRIGHLGIINKYIRKFPLSDDITVEKPFFRQLFSQIAAKGWQIDFDVAGLSKEHSKAVYITPWMLEKCRQHRIELVYGSDAHDVESVGRFYDIYSQTVSQHTGDR